MLKTYMRIFSIELSSEKLPILTKYIYTSKEYDRNFVKLHTAFIDKDKKIHRVLSSIEGLLWEQCRALRESLVKGFDRDVDDLSTPNIKCKKCDQMFYKPRGAIYTYSVGTCRDCKRKYINAWMNNKNKKRREARQ